MSANISIHSITGLDCYLSETKGWLDLTFHQFPLMSEPNRQQSFTLFFEDPAMAQALAEAIRSTSQFASEGAKADE